MTDGGATQVRRLEAPDIEWLRGLNQMFAEAFEDPEHYSRTPPGADYLTRLLRDPAFIAIAAVRDAQVVGGLVAYELKKFEQERSEIYLYDLAVAETYRRRGIATALVDALRDVARTCGAYVVFVQADKPDADAIAFYQSITNHQADVFHFDIPPG